MKTKNNDITDFYKQLSLLVKSELPLPQVLYKLAENFQKEDFRQVIEKLGKETESGNKLSHAMRQFPDYFESFHVRMIEAGEENNTLPDILSEIAFMARLNNQLVGMVREIAYYPIFTMYLSVAIFLSLLYFIVPGFGAMYYELLEGQSLPGVTELVLACSELTVQSWNVLLLIGIIVLLFCIWLFGNSVSANKYFLRIIRFLPLSREIFDNLMMARICSMWSLLMSQKIPAVEAFEIIAELIEEPRIEIALRHLSRHCLEGGNLVEGLEKEKIISGMLALTVKHVPEKELASELRNLAVIYRERVAFAIRNVGMMWEAALIVFMVVTVGTIIIALFTPLITIVEKLGG